MITLKLEGIDKAIQQCDKKAVIHSARIALNRAVSSGKTEMSKQIRQRFNITKFDIDRKIDIKKQSDLTSTIIIRGKPIILSYFKPRIVEGGEEFGIRRVKGLTGKAGFRFYAKGGGRSTGGVQVEIIKGRKTILKRAFLAVGKGGTPMVFQRRGRQLIGLAVYTEATMAKKEMDKVVNRIKEQWQKEWANQFKRLTS